MCLVRGELGVAKNLVEQEDYCALGPGSDGDYQITCVGWRSPLFLFVLPGPPFTPSEELGTASGLAAEAISCEREREVPLSSRLWKML